MKPLIAQLSFILIWGISFCNRTDAQSNSSVKTNIAERYDTFKTNLKDKDAIFYLDIDTGKYKNDWIEYDERPEFPGGEKALIDYIKKNTKYPQVAIKDSIYGKVMLIFSIDTDGYTGDFKIYKGICNNIDDECIRVVQEMPKWKPGTMLTESVKGWYWRPVKFWYFIPFNFLLHEDIKARGIVILPPRNK